MAIIGVDVGGTSIKAGLVENGKVKKRVEVSTNEFFEDILSVIEKLMTSYVSGIGVGFPAIVREGVVFDGVNIKIDNFPLKEKLEERFNLPVAVENDASCFALAEGTCGEGKGLTDFVVVTLGTGFGCGVILNGNLCSGGELSRIPMGKGKLEDYCSNHFFKNRGLSPFSAKKEDYVAFGTNLGMAVSIIINAYNPQKIFFSGKICKSWKKFKDYIVPKGVPKSSEVKLELSKLKDAGIVGAASLVNI